MANSNNGNRTASLLIAHDEAKSVLRERIGEGKELLARARGISNPGQLDEGRRAYNKWSAYNSEFLGRSFSDNSYRLEYERSVGFVMSVSSFSERVSNLEEDIQRNVDRLESLLDRLDLIPSSVAAFVDENASSAPPINSIFIAHGHDNEAKQSVARMIEQLGLKAIILDEQPQAGRTIIEKFEEHAGEVGFAIVLLTPDDVGAKAGDEENMKPRARQNVIFELGFFVGKLGRGKVCSLYKPGVEIPSDYDRVGYIEMDRNGGWQYRVADELQSAGFDVDKNNL